MSRNAVWVRIADRRRCLAAALALCALMTAGGVDAASITASIGVGLTLAASCRVDSATLTSRSATTVTRKAAVHCDSRAPHALRTSTEAPGLVLQRQVGESQTAGGLMRVVTLVF